MGFEHVEVSPGDFSFDISKVSNIFTRKKVEKHIAEKIMWTSDKYTRMYREHIWEFLTSQAGAPTRKSQEIHRKTIGKPLDNQRKTMGKP